MNPSLRLPALMLASALLTACENPLTDDYVCPAIVSAAIEVEIRDARTGGALAQHARGAIHDGAYIDSLKPAGSMGSDPSTLFSRSAGHGRPGNYRVEITHNGYRDWSADGIRVTMERCGVRTRQLSAALEPL
jgi:hypothetical protein